MFYNSKNVNLKIDGKDILATEVQLSYEAQIAPYYELGQEYAERIVPENVVQGSLNFSYYYTGIDPIKNLISRNESIEFDYGGIKERGYLKNYNVRFAPHNPIVCNAELTLFRAPTGTFSPTYNTDDILENIVHVNNISITNFNNQNISGSYLSANYSYTTEIRPEIYIGDTQERRGVFGPRETNLSIVCDNLNPLLEVSGLKVGAVLGVAPFSTSLITQGYSITGFLTKKSIQSRSEELLTNEITIKQYNVLEEAEIYGFNPTSGRYRDKIIITGKNFNYVAQVFFGEYEADGFTILSSDTITAIVPRARNISNQQIRMLTLA